MLFSNDYERLTEHDAWLINRYRNPMMKNLPASLLPGGITYISGMTQGRWQPSQPFVPEQLIAELDRAYFRLAQQDKITAWFEAKGFDL